MKNKTRKLCMFNIITYIVLLSALLSCTKSEEDRVYEILKELNSKSEILEFHTAEERLGLIYKGIYTAPKYYWNDAEIEIQDPYICEFLVYEDKLICRLENGESNTYQIKAIDKDCYLYGYGENITWKYDKQSHNISRKDKKHGLFNYLKGNKKYLFDDNLFFSCLMTATGEWKVDMDDYGNGEVVKYYKPFVCKYDFYTNKIVQTYEDGRQNIYYIERYHFNKEGIPTSFTYIMNKGYYDEDNIEYYEDECHLYLKDDSVRVYFLTDDYKFYNYLLSTYLKRGDVISLYPDQSNGREFGKRIKNKISKKSDYQSDYHNSYDETGIPCSVCNATGKCSYCQGCGKQVYGTQIIVCQICFGNGDCSSCHGKGKITSSMVSLEDIAAASSSSTSSSTSSSSTSSSSSSTSSYKKTKKCTNCNGVGKYHHPAQGKVPRFNGEKSLITCDNCGETNVDLEYHSCKCRVCDGKGYVYE